MRTHTHAAVSARSHIRSQSPLLPLLSLAVAVQFFATVNLSKNPHLKDWKDRLIKRCIYYVMSIKTPSPARGREKMSFKCQVGRGSGRGQGWAGWMCWIRLHTHVATQCRYTGRHGHTVHTHCHFTCLFFNGISTQTALSCFYLTVSLVHFTLLPFPPQKQTHTHPTYIHPISPQYTSLLLYHAVHISRI